MKVLIVDDSTANYSLMSQLLLAAGIGVESKYSGLNIVSYMDQHPEIDLVLMDIHMPIVDGLTAIHRLRYSEAHKQVKVIAVTADIDKMAIARQWGLDGFISKPIDPHRFADQVQAVFRGEPIWDARR